MIAGGLFCHVAGPADAPAVVLLHALATHGELWRPQWPAWSMAFRLIAIDLPGHGMSPAPTAPMTLADYADQVAAALDALGIQRAAVVGLSLGGMVAQAFALRQPGRVRSLVLAHTTARTLPAVRVIWDERLAQFEREGLEKQVEPTLGRWFAPAFAGASPLTMAWVARQIRATSSAGYTSAISAIRALDHFDRLGEISMPALVVAGDADAAIPLQAASALTERLPRAERFVLKDAGHLGNVQQPVAFTEAVGNFLMRTH
ncbi:MAG: alpha/beta fold hydrolase [Burkholderiales bacterium]|nr:alpha/beta fold hydrolase [Burkholderiales bacterium]